MLCKQFFLEHLSLSSEKICFISRRILAFSTCVLNLFKRIEEGFVYPQSVHKHLSDAVIATANSPTQKHPMLRIRI